MDDQIDDLDGVVTGQARFAESLEVAERPQRLGGLAGDVETQMPSTSTSTSAALSRSVVAAGLAMFTGCRSRVARRSSRRHIGQSQAALLGPLLADTEILAQQAPDGVGFRFELSPQDGRLGLDRFSPASRLTRRCSRSSRRPSRLGALLGFLGGAGRSGEHALWADVHVGQLDAAVGDQELPDLVGVAPSPGT